MLKVGALVSMSGALDDLRTINARMVPYVLASTLTRVGQRIKDAQRAEMGRVFDRPTPFTLNSVYLKPATTADPSAVVWLKDSADAASRQYLRPQVFGGGRDRKRFERALQRAGVMPRGWFAVPAKGARMDRYGNVRAAEIVELMSALGAFDEVGFRANRTAQSVARRARQRKRPGLKDYFAVTPDSPAPAGNGGRLPFGVYERQSRGRIRSVFKFVPRVTYRPRLAFYDVAQRVTPADTRAEFDRSFSDVAQRFLRRAGAVARAA